MDDTQTWERCEYVASVARSLLILQAIHDPYGVPMAINHTREMHAINKWSDQFTRRLWTQSPINLAVAFSLRLRSRHTHTNQNMRFVNSLYLFTATRHFTYCQLVWLSTWSSWRHTENMCTEILWAYCLLKWISVCVLLLWKKQNGANIENLSFINRFEMLCQTKLRLNDKQWQQQIYLEFLKEGAFSRSLSLPLPATRDQKTERGGMEADAHWQHSHDKLCTVAHRIQIIE